MAIAQIGKLLFPFLPAPLPSTDVLSRFIFREPTVHRSSTNRIRHFRARFWWLWYRVPGNTVGVSSVGILLPVGWVSTGSSGPVGGRGQPRASWFLGESCLERRFGKLRRRPSLEVGQERAGGPGQDKYHIFTSLDGFSLFKKERFRFAVKPGELNLRRDKSALPRLSSLWL